MKLNALFLSVAVLRFTDSVIITDLLVLVEAKLYCSFLLLRTGRIFAETVLIVQKCLVEN